MSVRGQGHSLTFAKATQFSKLNHQFGHLKENIMWKLLGEVEQNVYKWSGSQDKDGRHAHVW